jgi:hypothetical protein
MACAPFLFPSAAAENAIQALSAAMTVTSAPAEGVNMNQCFDRRSMLALSAAGVLAAALPGCTSPSSAPSQESYELTDYGYDASVPEAVPMDRPRRLDKVPPNASVRAEWLPPVGDQHMPNCFVWASVYGLATFYAARKSNTPPTTRDLQASPDYAYIRYQTSIEMARNTCQGGQVSKVLDWLKANGGTPIVVRCQLDEIWFATDPARSEIPYPRMESDDHHRKRRPGKYAHRHRTG